MPTEESKRVMNQRKANYDQISFLIETGGRELIRVLALREGCSGSEVIRRAVLARAGIRQLPYPDKLQMLDGVSNAKDAETAIGELQKAEKQNPYMKGERS